MNTQDLIAFAKSRPGRIALLVVALLVVLAGTTWFFYEDPVEEEMPLKIAYKMEQKLSKKYDNVFCMGESLLEVVDNQKYELAVHCSGESVYDVFSARAIIAITRDGDKYHWRTEDVYTK